MPQVPCVGVVGLLEVEPTFLDCLSNARWQHADVEMRKLARRARESHALFHVCKVYGVELMFCGTGWATRLVVPAICR